MKAIRSTSGRRRAIRNGVAGFATILALASVPTPSDALRGGDVITGFPGVVELSVSGMGSCTASMIARHVVLTAAHCFDALGAATNSSGTANFTVFYHDPEVGRRTVFSGPATWIVSPSYRGRDDDTSTAGNANADHALVVIGSGRFTNTNYHDYLRIYSDRKEYLDTDLQAYGAGSHTYSGQSDNRLRTTWFEVENVDYSHIVVDSRDEANVCKGDSGGPLMYFAQASGHLIPTITGVLAVMDTIPFLNGENCASNDTSHDDAFYSRISWEVIRFIEENTGVSCRVQSGADKEYVRCFDVPFIEDVEYEGLHGDLGAAIAVSSIL